ncbi:hypothetical protein M2103_001296 [Ereboglobus sp. PH5-5]|uniref:hypothetical protein n=1 Tax=Ereboglobus sp. PH5-5 TaxID=2940529 RepID=UPI0024070D0E|nr:hypothetical protein [Ereboglobus sp. PH5-5]MDF9833079.1 hypothetical protein [Ereboglobus sp. PH5-5]
MKTKILTPLIAVLALVAATGCTTATKTRQTAPLPMDIQATPVKVDYEVNTQEKKTGTASSAYLFGFIRTSGPNTFAENKGADAQRSMLGGRVNKLRLAAIHEALKNSNADRLLDPQYEAKIVTYPFGIFKKYVVTVKGYEAVVKDVYPDKN